MSVLTPVNAYLPALPPTRPGCSDRLCGEPGAAVTLRFSGLRKTTLPYKKLDPELTSAEIREYEQAEQAWHKLLEGTKPGAKGYDELRKRIEAEPDIELDFTRYKTPFNGHTKRTGEKIRIYVGNPDPENMDAPPFDKSVGYKTLAHELFHALHHRYTTWVEDTVPEGTSFKKAMQAYNDLYSPPMLRFLLAGRYRKKVRETISPLSQLELKALKQWLLSESICYRMEYQKFRNLPRGPHKMFDALTYKLGSLSAKWQKSVGYLDAIAIINAKLKNKNQSEG